MFKDPKASSGMIDPPQLEKPKVKRVQWERREQVAFYNLLKYYQHQNPELRWFHAVPNGGGRNGKEAAMLKASGVKAGVHDNFLPVARGIYHGLYLEFKAPEIPNFSKRTGARLKPRKNTQSPEQLEFGKFIKSQGYGSFESRDAEQAVKIVLHYLKLKPGEQSPYLT